MSIYQYARIYATESGIYFDCTNVNYIRDVQNLAQELFPTCNISTCIILQDEPYRLRIDKLEGHDLELGHLLVKFLCKKGWEPFASNLMQNQFITSHLDLHFRYRF